MNRFYTQRCHSNEITALPHENNSAQLYDYTIQLINNNSLRIQINYSVAI